MNTSPQHFYLVAIKRWTLLLAALLSGGALLLCGPRGQLGAIVGSGLMVLNTWLLGLLGQRIYRAMSGGHMSAVAVVVLFNVKLAGLLALCYLCLRYLPVDPLAFLLGVSVLPAAIFATAVQHNLRSLAAPTGTTQGEGQVHHG